MARHETPRLTRSLAPLILIGGVLLGALGFAWWQHLDGSGEVVASRVSMHGIDMSGMTPGEVRAVVSHDSRTTLETEITVEFPGGREQFSLEQLGFEYDQETTAANVLYARRSGGPFVQLASWAATPLFRTRADVAVRLDRASANRTIEDSIDMLTPIPPVEPIFSTDGRGRLTFAGGVTGKTVDLDDLMAQIEAVDPLNPPSTIEARLTDDPPTVTDEQAEEVVQTMTDLTATGVLVSVEGTSTRLSPEQIRQQLIITADSGAVTTRVDLDGLQSGIEALHPGPIGVGKKPSFEVIDGVPHVVKAGKPPKVCCDLNAAAIVAEKVLEEGVEPFRAIRLDTRHQDDPEAIAIADGSLITGQVSSFTTPHACCEDRVKNIQRMADMVDGYYLLPGEALSLNEYIGPRTEKNGFVAAGAIRRGHLIQEVGGGVSQFATTIFNAAYFAGLDFDEYRAHTIYFSRYPYGREATISNPAPDLVIRNRTEYPVLIGTSYTDTSITVSMYSTPNVRVEELGQQVSRQGACTHVETERERTFEDGRVIVDTVEATYRPAEGIDCSGNPIPEPE